MDEGAGPGRWQDDLYDLLRRNTSPSLPMFRMPATGLWSTDQAQHGSVRLPQPVSHGTL